MNYGSNLFSMLPNQSQSLFSPSWLQSNTNNLIKVNGIESVRAYTTMPNSTVVLFDANKDTFYVKTTDASNYPTIRVFNFMEEKIPKIETSEYVTKDEFNQFKEEIINGKQSVRSYSRKRLDGGRYTASAQDDECIGVGLKSPAIAAKSDSPESSIQ